MNAFMRSYVPDRLFQPLARVASWREESEHARRRLESQIRTAGGNAGPPGRRTALFFSYTLLCNGPCLGSGFLVVLKLEKTKPLTVEPPLIFPIACLFIFRTFIAFLPAFMLFSC